VIPSSEHKSVRAEVVQLRDAEFQLLKRDVERAPHLAVVQFRYGYALLERREFTAALTALRKAAELQPIPEFRVAYVQGLIAAEQEEAALAVLREILKDHPENASAARLLRQLEER
jgi:tetratricopeptide (TPR) repeat protein